MNQPLSLFEEKLKGALDLVSLMSQTEQQAAIAVWKQGLLRVNNFVNHNSQPSTDSTLNNSSPTVDHNNNNINNQGNLSTQDDTDNIIKWPIDDYASRQGQTYRPLTPVDSSHNESIACEEHQVYNKFLVPCDVSDNGNNYYELVMQTNTLESGKFVSDQDRVYVTSHLPSQTFLPHNNLIESVKDRLNSHNYQPIGSPQTGAECYAPQHVHPTTFVDGDDVSLPVKSEIFSAMENESDEPSNRCDTCGKSGFSTEGNLKRHQKTHSGAKPFRCHLCDSSFTEKKSLKIHIRRHTGEKPYQCTICHKSFAQSSVLKSHMDVHNDKRNFECNKCDKAFRQRSQLKLHLMRHEGSKSLECPTCKAKFFTKGDLTRHLRVHTGERPYICDICKNTFTRQHSLNEHMNRHIGAKPFSCEHCNMTFFEMSACSKHIKTHGHPLTSPPEA